MGTTVSVDIVLLSVLAVSILAIKFSRTFLFDSVFDVDGSFPIPNWLSVSRSMLALVETGQIVPSSFS